MREPEQFKEIINADRYDQQAAQGICHGMKDLYLLYKKYIDQGDARIYAEHAENDLPRRGVAYDAVKDKIIKAKGKDAE